MRERKHFRQQVILIEVLEVVDLVERAEVFRCSVLDLCQNPLILDKARPVLGEVVLIGVVERWIVLDLIEVIFVFEGDR